MKNEINPQNILRFIWELVSVLGSKDAADILAAASWHLSYPGSIEHYKEKSTVKEYLNN